MKKFVSTLILLAAFLPTMALAQAARINPPPAGSAAETKTPSGEVVHLGNPLGENVTPQKLIGRVIKAIMGIVGSLALLMFVWGGFQWMTAAGNEEKITKGKNTLTWAALGMIVIFSSYVLVNFLIKSITPEVSITSK